ncbi:MAG: flagellin [Oscillibacter sp.]|nr:flagellin [Oscillibacter sp.]
MRIQHNIMAMNAYRNYNTNTSALSKNLEKLSSGYKINRAGDDAAGLAISEKMRAQITGLNAAQKNVKDGISLVKTAEGAMQEIQDMLNRMEYLATQSSNGTYDNEVDRANLQKEVTALKTEIDRIADSANFNGIKLLDGSQSGVGGVNDSSLGTDVDVTAVRDATTDVRGAQAGEYSIDLSQFKAVTTGSEVKIKVAGQTVATATVTANSRGTTVSVNNVKATSSKVVIGNQTFTVTKSGNKILLKMDKVPTSEFTTKMNVTISGAKASMSAGNQAWPEAVKVEKPAIAMDTAKFAQGSFTLTNEMILDGAQIKIGKDVYTFKVGKDGDAGGVSGNVIDLSHLDPNSTKLAAEASRLLSQAASGNSWFKVTSDNSSGKVYLTEKLENRPYENNMVGASVANTADADWSGLVKYDQDGGMATAKGGLTLQIGDTADDYNRMDVQIGDMHVSALGIDDLDISTPEGAKEAIDKIKSAINNVSSVRGDLGAIQNRLEHTANNLSVMAENIQDAESTIRDTDVAEEMMAYTKNNILIQSAQAMLAQANAVPQGVLQLLG